MIEKNLKLRIIGLELHRGITDNERATMLGTEKSGTASILTMVDADIIQLADRWT